MSYRMIALASSLLLVGCGGAPPPPASPPSTRAAREPVDSHTAAPVDSTPSPDVAAPPPPAKSSTTPPVEGQASTSPGAAGAGEAKPVGQAVVVDVHEPLGGKLTQDDIRRIVEKSGDVFGDCYTLGAGGKTKDFKGVVTVKATIGPNGVINQASVTKSTANNVKVDACVSEAFKKIKFPKPQGGATSVIVFPVAFNGIEQIQ